MTDSKNARYVEISSQEKKYLKDLKMNMEAIKDCAKVALSERESAKLSRIDIPNPFEKNLTVGPGRKRTSFDVDWTSIKKDEIHHFFRSNFIKAYFQMYCRFCDYVLIPYIIPRRLSRIVREMEEYIYLPEHVCSKSGKIFQITAAKRLIPIIDENSISGTRHSEIFKVRRAIERKHHIKYVGSEIETGYLVLNSGDATIIPPAKLTSWKLWPNTNKSLITAKYDKFYNKNHLEIEAIIEVTRDIVSFQYFEREIVRHKDEFIVVPAHLYWIQIKDITINRTESGLLQNYYGFIAGEHLE